MEHPTVHTHLLHVAKSMAVTLCITLFIAVVPLLCALTVLRPLVAGID